MGRGRIRSRAPYPRSLFLSTTTTSEGHESLFRFSHIISNAENYIMSPQGHRVLASPIHGYKVYLISSYLINMSVFRIVDTRHTYCLRAPTSQSLTSLSVFFMVTAETQHQ